MPLVFVSHTSSDKPKLRPIIDALLEEGHEIFFDNPNKLRPRYLREERRKKFKRLKNISEYPGQLREALRDCDVVLGCLTPQLRNDKRVWEDELKYALTANKLVCFRLGEFSTSDLPAELGGMLSPGRLQALKIDPNLLSEAEVKRDRGEQLTEAEEDAIDNLETVLDDIDDLMKGAVDQSSGAESNVPYNTATKISTAAVLEGICTLPRLATVSAFQAKVNTQSLGDVTPLIVAGPHNEMVEMFASNTWTIDTNLREGSDGAEVYEVTVSLVSEVELDDQLFESLNQELSPPVDPTMYATSRARAIAASLKADPRKSKFIVYSPISAKLLESGLEPIEAWLQFWAHIRDAADGGLSGVIPILPVLFDPADAGWDICNYTKFRRAELVPKKSQTSGFLFWRREGRCANSELHEKLIKLVNDGQNSDGLNTRYLPLLSPLRWMEIRNDLKKTVSDALFERIRKRTKQFFRVNERPGIDFDGPTVQEQSGVPMLDFHHFFSDLLNETHQSNRTR